MTTPTKYSALANGRPEDRDFQKEFSGLSEKEKIELLGYFEGTKTRAGFLWGIVIGLIIGFLAGAAYIRYF